MIHQLRYNLMQRRCSLFRFQVWLWLVSSIICSCVAVLFSAFILSFSIYGIRVLLYFAVFAILFGAILYIVYRHDARSLLLENEDRKCRNCIQETVILMSSQPRRKRWFLNLPDIVLGTIFWKERASYHICYFKNTEDHLKKSFCYILTAEKANAFASLFGAKVTYRDIGIWPYKIFFESELPVRIVYGEKSRFLKAILPVEDIPYSKEQLQAFYAFNETEEKPLICLEEESVNDMLSFSRIKAFLLKKHKSPLVFSPLFICVGVILFSVLAVSLIVFFHLLYLHAYRVLMVCPLGFIVALLYFMVFSDGFFPFESEKNQRIEKATVYLKSSKPLRWGNGFSRYLRLIFPEETPLLQIASVCFPKGEKVLQIGSPKEIYWTVSQSKLRLLKELYDCDLHHICSYNRSGGHSLIRTELSFRGDVPVEVCYTKKKHELKSIAPAEDYDYTPEQLAAIERFNTLYP